MVTEVSRDARYTHPSYGGIAMYVADEPVHDMRETHEVIPHEDDPYAEEHDIDECGGEHHVYDVVPEIREGWVNVVMVGDDRLIAVEVAELTEIPEDAYCAGCGQVGCPW